MITSPLPAPQKITQRAKKFAQEEAKRKRSLLERRKASFHAHLWFHFKKTPFWFASFVFHTVLLFLFAHILFFPPHAPPKNSPLHLSWELPHTIIPPLLESPPPASSLSSVTTTTESEEEASLPPSLKPESFVPQESPLTLPLPLPLTLPHETREIQERKAEDLSSPQALERITPPLPPSDTSLEALSSSSTSSEASSAVVATTFAYFQNRRGKAKSQALLAYGGGADTENAVALGLDWLVRHQSPEGYWSGVHYFQQCHSQYPCEDRHSVYPRMDYPVGLTGLALLCFLGSGEIAKDSSYGKALEKGLSYLLANQKWEYYGKSHYPMNYEQGIACLAMVEAYALFQEERFKVSAQRAILYLEACQQKQGGWDYYDTPTDRNDLSITGWVVMALKAAQEAGLEVQALTHTKIKIFLQNMYHPQGYFYAKGPHFQPEEQTGIGMTAVGLLCQIYQGISLKDTRLQVSHAHLKHCLPRWRILDGTSTQDYTVYALYYGTLALFHWGGKSWQEWNKALKEALLPSQEKGFCNRGSWVLPKERYRFYEGRLYTTLLHLLSLEVYYRYLPLYRSVPVERQKQKTPHHAKKK
jgi:hypothetical protein